MHLLFISIKMQKKNLKKYNGRLDPMSIKNKIDSGKASFELSKNDFVRNKGYFHLL